MSLIKKQVLIGLLLFLFVIQNGCLSNDKETYKTQTQAYNDEQVFYKNSLEVINNCYNDIGKHETSLSITAVRELLIQLELIEERYLSSNFDEIVPCKDATNFIVYNLDAVRLGKSAMDNINKFYNQDSSSSKCSTSNWYSFVSDISNVYSNLNYAERKLDSIRNTLEQGVPIK